MKKCLIVGSRGSTLVLNLLIMAVFALMAAISYKAAKTVVGDAVYNARSAEAMAIAEAGLEDALHALALNSGWRSGFSQKAFAGGYYTVTVATPSPFSMTIASTGYSSSKLLTGRAVKTVAVTALFYSTATAANVVQSNNLTVNGVVNAYDARVSTNPTTFIDGGTIWANSVATGGSCGSARIFTNVMYQSGNTGPGSGCVNTPTDTVTTTTTVVSLPLHTCDATCQAQAMTTNNQINVQNPVTLPYSNPGGNNPALNITQDQVVTISSGTYYFKSVSVTKGVLNIDTNSGPVTMFFTNSFTVTDNASHPCKLNNLSGVPSRLLIADLTGSHTVTLSCASAPIHAYMEGSANQFNVQSGQVFYGHFSGGTTSVASGATVHFDLSGGYPIMHMTWSTGSNGSWSESYKRQ